jgi:hypothetical protein
MAILSLWACLRIVMAAKRLAPDMLPPNCWIYAGQEWGGLMGAWHARGRPKEEAPYMVVRPSRAEPYWVMHVLVGESYNSDSGHMPLRSYKPVAPSNAKWWQVCQRVVFDGRVKDGDVT